MVDCWCSLGRILAGTERRDPGEGFPVQHVEPFPLGGQHPVPLSKLLLQSEAILHSRPLHDSASLPHVHNRL